MMADIDVSDLLADPDFVDKLILIHRKPFVNDFGENELEETGTPSVGCVQPASGRTLQRLPEALRVINVSSFWLKGRITADGKHKYPDIILFKGVRYAVQVVFDWSNWGVGYCEGTCVQERPSL
jgi:hypothetical protein